MNKSIEIVAKKAEASTRKLLDYYLSAGGEGFKTEEIVTLQGESDREENEDTFQELGNYLCGMKILCIYNTGNNGLTLYLAKRWDCTFYALSQKIIADSVHTVLEHIKPDDSDYFLGNEDLYFVIERMKKYF